MLFIVGLLTVVLVLDCLVLVLLVLIQLPKKEAGVGVAFGGAATDALFGAGSGNVLTKATKYAAVLFFSLAVVLSLLQSRLYHRTTSEFRKELEQQGQQAPVPAPADAPGAPGERTPGSATSVTGLNLLTPTADITNQEPSPPPE